MSKLITVEEAIASGKNYVAIYKVPKGWNGKEKISPRARLA